MRVEASIEISAPPALAWEHVADPAHYLHFMHGVTRWEVAGGRAIGLGARYAFSSGELDTALRDLATLLAPGGRLLVITFHSLEDRVVKNTFRSLQYPCTCPPKAPICTCGKKPLGRVLGGGAIPPGAEELETNPRARSAKLRVFERRAQE